VKELAIFQDRAYVVASEAAWIDISNLNVHKGTTVAQLQSILNIDKSETIAFGDGFNDIELFSQAGISVAMKNAFEEVKIQADFITKSNDEDGVLRAIEKFITL
jgi:hydroxymethylpyrimidine pyrophosphatase-like HAD family hydrolase